MRHGQGRKGAREPSVHQLRLFLLLTEELHFGKAAARAFVTQPAFSQQIKALEQRLGVSLVERAGRTVRLTAAGRGLADEAEAVIGAMARFRQVADMHAGVVRGHVVVGSLGATAATPAAQAVMAHLRRHHPDLEIELRNLDFIQQFEALRRGEVDAAFLYRPVPREIRFIQLTMEPRVVGLPDDDPLAAESELTSPNSPAALSWMCPRRFRNCGAGT